jgi:hypothetical protein
MRTSNNSEFVTPTKAGVQLFRRVWIPDFAGMTFLVVTLYFI